MKIYILSDESWLGGASIAKKVFVGTQLVLNMQTQLEQLCLLLRVQRILEY